MSLPTRRLRGFASALLSAACATANRAPGELPSPMLDAAGDSLHAVTEALADSSHVPALSVAIARHGRVLLSYAVGYARPHRSTTT